MRIIKLMADYQCYPLWDISPNFCGDIDPNILPISKCLKEGLKKWSDVFDQTLNLEDPKKSGFKSKGEEIHFKNQGISLFKQLQKELGNKFIIVFDV